MMSFFSNAAVKVDVETERISRLQYIQIPIKRRRTDFLIFRKDVKRRDRRSYSEHDTPASKKPKLESSCAAL